MINSFVLIVLLCGIFCFNCNKYKESKEYKSLQKKENVNYFTLINYIHSV